MRPTEGLMARLFHRRTQRGRCGRGHGEAPWRRPGPADPGLHRPACPGAAPDSVPEARPQRRFAPIAGTMALLLAAGLLAACSDRALQSPGDTAALLNAEPDPRLAPAEVVRIQLEALRANGELPDNAGIRLAFRFASPGNQASTGPVERFIGLVQQPPYSLMLNHREARLGERVQEGDRVAQRVTLTTLDFRTVSYVFVLRHEAVDRCAGRCCVTDAVHPWPSGDAPPPRRVSV